MSDEDKECIYSELIVDLSKACQYAIDNCGEDFEVLNLFRYQYCSMPEGVGGMILFWITCLLLMLSAFFLLGKIASMYLTPVLTKISEALQLSETVSGVTLLAFANGAPDIISSVAAGEQQGGLYITIGNLFGAGLFGTTLLIARCIQVSKRRIVMEPNQWNRDLIFYIITCLMMVVYGIVSYIDAYMAGLFYVVYAVYIIMVLYQDKKYRSQDPKQISSIDVHEQDKKRIQEKMHKLLNHESADKLITGSMIDEDTLGVTKARGLSLTQAEIKKIYNQEQESLEIKVIQEDPNNIDIFLHYLTAPLKYIAMITIPNLEKEEAAKFYSPLLIITGTFTSFLLVVKEDYETKKFFGLQWYYVALILSLTMLIAAYTLKVQGSRQFEWILVPVALVVCILWLKTAAGFIVDIINYLSTVYGINKVLLGATFLGIGNALADLFANASLSALGYGVMACTGSVAGQLFNLLMSIPLNFFIGLYKKDIKKIEFDLLDLSESKQDKVFTLMIIWLLIGQLLFIYYMSISSKYELNMTLAKISVVVYVICYIVFFLMNAVISE
jgi:sodium/potassium/calcium exchanger 6